MLGAMRKALGFLALGVCAISVGCSAGKTTPGSATNGRGGTESSGGSATGTGGGASGGTGSTGATAGTFVLVDASMPTGGSDGDAMIDAGSCATLNVQTVEVVPTVDLLVDTSGSMFQNPAPFWTPLYNALMDPTNGVVKQLQHTVRFGFTSFTGTGTGAMCPLLQKVPYAIDNYDAINAVYGAIAKTYNGQKWETPTHAAVAAAAADLAAFVPVPDGPKFILLVTDGSPDTCWANDPQCGQDASIKAVQDAQAKGINTYVLGIGDILDPAADGCSAGRCGKDYLQDVANAGTGQPVEPTSDTNYKYSSCVQKNPNAMPAASFVATYAATGGGGKAPYYTVSGSGTTADVTPLVTAIKQALIQTRSCTFAMTATLPSGMTTGVKITTNAAKGMFNYNDAPLAYNDPNGWTLTADQTGITLNGTTCDSWKTAGGTLTGSFPCEVTFDPVPPPPPPK